MFHSFPSFYCRSPLGEAVDKENQQDIKMEVLDQEPDILPAHDKLQINNNNISPSPEPGQQQQENLLVNGTATVSSETDQPAEEQVLQPQPDGDAADDSFAFALGDVVWAYVSGCPLWPALISKDEANGGLYTKLRSRKASHQSPNHLLYSFACLSFSAGKFQTRCFYARFFCDKGNYNWMLESALFPFTGGVDELMKDEGFIKHVSSIVLSKFYIHLTLKNLFYSISQVNSKSKLYKSLPQPDENLVGKKKNWSIALEEAKECLLLPRYLLFEQSK